MGASAPRGQVSQALRRSAPERVDQTAMPGYDDDDDWVGTPPEGRYSRERADPEHWRRPWPLAAAGMTLLLVILALVLILH